MRKLIFVVLICLGARLDAAIVTLCASGCDATTWEGAEALAGSGDTIEMQSSINGQLDLNKNIAGIRSDCGACEWTMTAGGSNMLVDANLTQALDIRDIHIHKNGTNESRCYFQDTATVGSSVTFTRVIFERSSTSSTNAEAFYADNISISDYYNLEKCRFTRSGGSTFADGVSLDTGVAFPDVFDCQNCIFENWDEGIQGLANTGNTVIKCFNCTFDQNAEGINSDSDGNFRNCLFTNTNDLVLGGQLTKNDFLDCAFEEQTNTGGWDASIIFGITATDEYANQAADDLHLKAGAQSIGTGQTIGSVTDDFDGVSRPQGIGYDIGAYEFVMNGPPLGSLFLMGVGN